MSGLSLPLPNNTHTSGFSQFNLYKLGALEEDFTTVRVPKRLSGKTFELVRRLIKNNSKCPYGALLNKYCPNTHERASIEISKKILSQTHWADNTTHVIDQHDLPLTNDDTPDISFLHLSDKSLAASQWEEMKKVDLSSNFHGVFLFCKSVIKHVIPKEFIGSPENWDHLLSCVSKFVRLRRHEDLRLSYIIEGMSIPDVWLDQKGHGQTHFYKCRELQLEFLYWIFHQFLTPLLRSHFYATEVSGMANKVVYYRHDVWVALTEPAFEEFKSQSLTPIPRRIAREMVFDSKIGTPSVLRFIPKPEGGYRAIICLGRSREETVYDRNIGQSISAPQKSVNTILKNVFTALSFEHWKSGRSKIGAAICSTNDLNTRLCEFKKQLTFQGDPLPKLYFVKADIKKCYDTIPSSVAFQLAEQLLKNNYTGLPKTYYIHGFNRISCKADSKVGRTKYLRLPEYATSSIDASKAIQSAANRGARKTSSNSAATRVFVDQAKGAVCDGEELLELLEEHIMQNMIRVGRTVYVQNHGIPQGSILSTLLCNIVYAKMEQDIFPKETKQSLPPYLLVRFVDDFLFVSPNRSLAELFLTRMAEGFPDVGAFIHKDKTLTNFKPRKFNDEFGNGAPNYREVTTLKQVSKDGTGRYMPYIGLNIDTQTLQVSKLHSTNSGSSFADSLTVRAHGAPNSLANFKSSITRLVKMRLSQVMLSPELNTWPTILKNIQDVAAEVAKRVLLGTSLWLGKNARFSAAAVNDTVSKAILLTIERTRSAHGKKFETAREQEIVNVVAGTFIESFQKAKRHKMEHCIKYLETLII